MSKIPSLSVSSKSFSTLTIACRESELPLTSVTVRVTILSPTSSQVNKVISNSNVSSPSQLSTEPSLMSEGVINAYPLESKNTVIY